MDLAETQALLGVYFEPPREHMPEARQEALHALQLNPGLNAAHGILGVVALLYDWDYATAVSELRSGDSRRGALDTLACTVHLLDQTGHARNAEETLRTALAYNPQSAMLPQRVWLCGILPPPLRRSYPALHLRYAAGSGISAALLGTREVARSTGPL